MKHIAVALLSIFLAGSAQCQIITTIAGRGIENKTFAIATPLTAGGITFDLNNNAYITDSYRHMIYRVDATTNLITPVAGTGTSGYTGDGGLASHAKLNTPGNIVTDSKGNLIFFDTKNNVIRMITPGGYISTIAGNGTGTFAGDNGDATKASLETNSSLAIDKDDNIYFFGSSRVRKISATTGIVTTVVGNGQHGFSGDGGPATSAKINSFQGLACASNGDLYVADGSNFRIRKVSAATGNISTIAGIGNNNMLPDDVPAISNQVTPRALAVDQNGIIYITESYSSRVRKIDSDGMIRAVSGIGVNEDSGDFGPAVNAGLYQPDVVVFDGNGNTYIVAGNMRRIDKTTQIIETFAGQMVYNVKYLGDGKLAGASMVLWPWGVAVSNENDIYISEADGGRIRKIDGKTNNISTLLGPVANPTQIVFGSQNELYFAEESNNIIRKIDLTTGDVTTVAGVSSGIGSYGGDGGLATNANFWGPRGIAFDNNGNIYICDAGNSIVRKVDKVTGIVTRVAGNATQGYSGDGGLATSAKLNGPRGIAFDSNDDMYITDSENHVIRKVDHATGFITTVAGNGTPGYSGDGGLATSAEMLYPEQIALDRGNRILYCVEYGNNVVRRIDLTTQMITTFAGTGVAGFSGDNGLAKDAKLYQPSGIGLDNDGNVYVGDSRNGVVRKVQGCLQSISQPSPTSQSLCVGATAQPLSVSVTGSSAFTYQWYANSSPNNVGGTKINGATSGTYTPGLPESSWYYVAITGSCGTFNSSISGLVSRSNLAKPTISLDGTSLWSSIASGYQWYLNGSAIPGAVGRNHTAVAKGSYTVVTSDGSCQSEASQPANVIVTGLYDSFKALEVYPNPVRQYLTIRNIPANGVALISDITGAVLMKVEMTDAESELNVSGLASGLYLLRVPGTAETFKFIKQ